MKAQATTINAEKEPGGRSSIHHVRLLRAPSTGAKRIPWVVRSGGRDECCSYPDSLLRTRCKNMMRIPGYSPYHGLRKGDTGCTGG
jgi:hypothetical protein